MKVNKISKRRVKKAEKKFIISDGDFSLLGKAEKRVMFEIQKISVELILKNNFEVK